MSKFMLPTQRLLVLGAILLAGCGDDTSTAPRVVSGETRVTATITSVADVFLWASSGPSLHAQVLVRNAASESVSIIPCSSHIEIRLPSAEVWTNVGFARVGLCPIPETPLASGATTELGASGSSDEFRVVAGTAARAVVIRAKFLVRSGTEEFFVNSDEYTITRP